MVGPRRGGDGAARADLGLRAPAGHTGHSHASGLSDARRRAPPLTIASPTFHAGEIGVAYAPVTLSATGGVTPYHWVISVGALPAGLDLSADGVVSGTPTANGSYAFSVQVFDSDSDTAGIPTSVPIASV